jgi:hypothetical protein
MDNCKLWTAVLLCNDGHIYDHLLDECIHNVINAVGNTLNSVLDDNKPGRHQGDHVLQLGLSWDNIDADRRRFIGQADYGTKHHGNRYL